MRITRVTVTAGISRCRDYQTVKCEIQEEVELDENDDREAIIKDVKNDLFNQVNLATINGLNNMLAS